MGPKWSLVVSVNQVIHLKSYINSKPPVIGGIKNPTMSMKKEDQTSSWCDGWRRKRHKMETLAWLLKESLKMFWWVPSVLHLWLLFPMLVQQNGVFKWKVAWAQQSIFQKIRFLWAIYFKVSLFRLFSSELLQKNFIRRDANSGRLACRTTGDSPYAQVQ